jgi:hypothetical protein
MLCTGNTPAPRVAGSPSRSARATAPAEDVPILVVDDDQDFCTGVRRALASLPFQPFAVHDGVDALRFLAGAPPFHDAPRPAFVVLDTFRTSTPRRSSPRCGPTRSRGRSRSSS